MCHSMNIYGTIVAVVVEVRIGRMEPLPIQRLNIMIRYLNYTQ